MITVSNFLKKDNNNLDLLRIICAMLVIYGHSFTLADRGGAKDLISHFFPFSSSGSVAVKVFFFISGMLVTASLLKSHSALQFVISRSLRILPAYIFVVLSSAIIIGPIFTDLPILEYFKQTQVCNYIIKNLGMDIQYFLPGVFSSSIYKPVINGSLWTIPFEISSYICLLAIFMITKLKNKTITNLACIIIISSSIIPGWQSFFTGSNINTIYHLPSCFALGVLYATNQESIYVSKEIPIGLFLLYFMMPNKQLSEMMFYFSICTLSIYLVSGRRIISMKLKKDISYGIYLWGFVVQQIIYSVKPDLNIYVNISISIFITVTIATISFILIERPAMELSVSIRKRLINNK